MDPGNFPLNVPAPTLNQRPLGLRDVKFIDRQAQTLSPQSPSFFPFFDPLPLSTPAKQANV